jgi:hypothetical protein
MSITTRKEALKIAARYFSVWSEKKNYIYVARECKRNEYDNDIYRVFFYKIPKSINKTFNQLTETEKEEYSYISLVDNPLPYHTGKKKGFVILNGRTGRLSFPKY